MDNAKLLKAIQLKVMGYTDTKIANKLSVTIQTINNYKKTDKWRIILEERVEGMIDLTFDSIYKAGIVAISTLEEIARNKKIKYEDRLKASSQILKYFFDAYSNKKMKDEFELFRENIELKLVDNDKRKTG